MALGVLEIDLYLPGCTSLKEKRLVISSLKQKVRARFNVSVAELDGQDLWQRAKIGVAVISSDPTVANSLLSKVMRFVENDGRFHVLDFQMTWY